MDIWGGGVLSIGIWALLRVRECGRLERIRNTIQRIQALRIVGIRSDTMGSLMEYVAICKESFQS